MKLARCERIAAAIVPEGYDPDRVHPDLTDQVERDRKEKYFLMKTYGVEEVNAKFVRQYES